MKETSIQVGVDNLNVGEVIATAPPNKARPPTHLSILAWNVWVGKREQTRRYDHIVSQVVELAPDVACFQEVTSPFIRALKSNETIQRLYYVTSNPISGYGILSIARKDISHEISFEEVALPSNMGRSLLVTNLPVGSKGGNDEDCGICFVQVGNVHLESLANADERRQQLAASDKYLTRDVPSQHAAAVLVGDFNFDCSQNWGDWKESPPSSGRLENEVLAEVMPCWIDVWPHLKGDGDPGKTFDGASNAMCQDPQERMRYDRVMVRADTSPGKKLRLEPLEIRMVGTETMDETGLKASDHYGVLSIFRIAWPIMVHGGTFV
ncbi:hypothetical protein ACHAWF_001908 [Thalassiosira exigua]